RRTECSCQQGTGDEPSGGPEDVGHRQRRDDPAQPRAWTRGPGTLAFDDLGYRHATVPRNQVPTCGWPNDGVSFMSMQPRPRSATVTIWGTAAPCVPGQPKRDVASEPSR